MPTKYIYPKQYSQGLMLHKQNCRALCKGISLISAEDRFLSSSESALMLLTIKQHPWHLSQALSRGKCDLNGLRHLNHKSFSHVVDKSRWRQAKPSCDTCNLSGWAEGGKPGPTHSYPHSSSAQCDPPESGLAGQVVSPWATIFLRDFFNNESINKEEQKFSRISWL